MIEGKREDRGRGRRRRRKIRRHPSHLYRLGSDELPTPSPQKVAKLSLSQSPR